VFILSLALSSPEQGYSLILSGCLSLYVSKTVAGEVLMEIETRPAAMSALKLLDGEGYLRFDLA
jgi:hypothetical protein